MHEAGDALHKLKHRLLSMRKVSDGIPTDGICNPKQESAKASLATSGDASCSNECPSQSIRDMLAVQDKLQNWQKELEFDFPSLPSDDVDSLSGYLETIDSMHRMRSRDCAMDTSVVSRTMSEDLWKSHQPCCSSNSSNASGLHEPQPFANDKVVEACEDNELEKAIFESEAIFESQLDYLEIRGRSKRCSIKEEASIHLSVTDRSGDSDTRMLRGCPGYALLGTSRQSDTEFEIVSLGGTSDELEIYDSVGDEEIDDYGIGESKCSCCREAEYHVCVCQPQVAASVRNESSHDAEFLACVDDEYNLSPCVSREGSTWVSCTTFSTNPLLRPNFVLASRSREFNDQHRAPKSPFWTPSKVEMYSYSTRSAASQQEEHFSEYHGLITDVASFRSAEWLNDDDEDPPQFLEFPLSHPKSYRSGQLAPALPIAAGLKRKGHTSMVLPEDNNFVEKSLPRRCRGPHSISACSVRAPLQQPGILWEENFGFEPTCGHDGGRSCAVDRHIVSL